MRLVVVSDTHCHDIKTPHGTALFLVGDATMMGTRQEYTRLDAWFAQQTQKEKYFIPGNHDRNPSLCSELIKNATILVDQEVTVTCGAVKARVYGSPWVPWIDSRWAYQFLPGTPMAKETWSRIPDNLDVLMTHTPAEVLGERWGCLYLQERLEEMVALGTAPHVHVVGHIHEAHGVAVNKGILTANVAICNEGYDPVNPVTILELDRKWKWRVKHC